MWYSLLATLAALDPAQLQSLLDERTVQTQKATGIIAALVDGNGVTIKSSGPAKLTSDSVLEIGSVTKVFTGILLAEMAARGEVQLTDPVNRYLPESARLPQRDGKPITLLSLSTQSSGLPRLPPNLKPADGQNPYADYSVDLLHAALPQIKLEHDPFERYEYSNLGVGLLGHALARRAGKSYEALLRERVLTPLGMKDTVIVLDEHQRKRLAPGHDQSLTPVKNWDIPTLAGAGALRSTINDMVKFLRAQLEPGRIKGPLGQALKDAQRIHRPPADGTKEPAIGLGWHMLQMPGRPLIVWHNGGTGGYRSWAGFSPEAKQAAVVLCDTAYSVDDVGRHLLDPQAPLNKPVAAAQRREVLVSDDTLRKYPGRYQLTPEFFIHITLEDGRLHLQATNQPKFPLFAASETRFFLRVVEAEIEFTSAGLVLHQNGRSLPATKQ